MGGSLPRAPVTFPIPNHVILILLKHKLHCAYGRKRLRIFFKRLIKRCLGGSVGEAQSAFSSWLISGLKQTTKRNFRSTTQVYAVSSESFRWGCKVNTKPRCFYKRP